MDGQLQPDHDAGNRDISSFMGVMTFMCSMPCLSSCLILCRKSL